MCTFFFYTPVFVLSVSDCSTDAPYYCNNRIYTYRMCTDTHAHTLKMVLI